MIQAHKETIEIKKKKKKKQTGPIILQFGGKDIHMTWYYRNDPKFSDRYAWANSADPDQTAIPSTSFRLITLW